MKRMERLIGPRCQAFQGATHMASISSSLARARCAPLDGNPTLTLKDKCVKSIAIRRLQRTR